MSEISSASWTLTAKISPRPYVRVADSTLDDGTVANVYRGTVLLTTGTPTTPWAMHLADERGDFRFLCFDLDAGRGNAAYDAGRLSLWLGDLNIEHLICESGPSGGRHVWVGLERPAAAGDVALIARLASQLIPSLDVSPLTNARTGCVRPPGAPHRTSGFSVAVAGALSTLEFPETTAADLDALRALLIDAGAEINTDASTPPKGSAVDNTGHPYLIGTGRPLTARIRDLIDADPGPDTSVTLARVLAGCARARLRFSDVLPWLHTSPAFEHARSIATGAERTPVSAEAAVRRLTAAWARAVRFTASNPAGGDGTDAEFVERATIAAGAVAEAQAAADTQPGLWGSDGSSSAIRAGRGSYVNRLVLNAVCLYLVQSASPTVEVDTRRLAADTGYGRESCRLALVALSTPTSDAESSWIVKTVDAEGKHGARFRLSTRYTGSASRDWAQAVTRPPNLELRTWWINELGSSLSTLANDIFAAPHSIGRIAGRVMHALGTSESADVVSVARRAGLSPGQARRALHRLAGASLAVRTAGGWGSGTEEDLQKAAVELDVDGYLDGRAAEYAAERGAWAWWQAEHRWLSARQKRRKGRRGGTGLALFAQSERLDFPVYPRRSNKRPDHRTAKQLVKAGALRPAHIWT